MPRLAVPSRLTGDAGAGRAAATARAATVAVLLAVAVIRLRARGSLPDRTSSSLSGVGGTVVTSIFGAAEGAGLVAFGIVLALALRRPRRHKPEDEAHEQWRPPLPWWAKTIAVLFALAMLTAPWIILLASRNRRNSTPLAPLRPPVPRPGPGHLAAPALGALALMPRQDPSGELAVDVALSRSRCFEGEDVTVTAIVRAPGRPLEEITIELEPSPRSRWYPGAARRRSCRPVPPRPGG